MKLIVFRGDTKIFNVEIRKNDGAPFDLTGSTIRFTAKRIKDEFSTNDTSAIIRKDNAALGGVAIIDALNGKFNISLSSIDTQESGTFLYDIQITKGNNIYTVAKDELVIIEDITKTQP